MYLKAIRLRLELARKLLMMDIQAGKEVLIPKDFCQEKLPYSIRYYDPIIAIIQENVTDEMRETLKFKNLVALAIHRRNDGTTNLLETLGFNDGGKLSAKLEAINDKV